MEGFGNSRLDISKRPLGFDRFTKGWIPRSVLAIAVGMGKTQCIVGVPCLDAVMGPHSEDQCSVETCELINGRSAWVCQAPGESCAPREGVLSTDLLPMSLVMKTRSIHAQGTMTHSVSHRHTSLWNPARRLLPHPAMPNSHIIFKNHLCSL